MSRLQQGGEKDPQTVIPDGVIHFGGHFDSSCALAQGDPVGHLEDLSLAGANHLRKIETGWNLEADLHPEGGFVRPVMDHRNGGRRSF